MHQHTGLSTHEKFTSETLGKLMATSCGAWGCYKLQCRALIMGEVCWCEHPHEEFAGKGMKHLLGSFN